MISRIKDKLCIQAHEMLKCRDITEQRRDVVSCAVGIPVDKVKILVIHR